MYFQGGYGGPATKALLNSPYTVALDGQGNLFISNYHNFHIRRVDGQTGIISTVVGTGTGGYNGDGIPATGAEIFLAITVIADKLGNLYIADSGNNRIRRVDGKIQIITTVAGDGTGGFGGDGGLATKAELSFPNAGRKTGRGIYPSSTQAITAYARLGAKTQIIKTSAGSRWFAGSMPHLESSRCGGTGSQPDLLRFRRRWWFGHKGHTE